jgi:ATP-dependent DNA helicase RecQ
LGVSFEELIHELDQIVNSGTKLNLRYFLNQFIEEELQVEVMSYFKTVDVADMEGASGYFDGDFSMEELELMHIQFLSDVGN